MRLFSSGGTSLRHGGPRPQGMPDGKAMISGMQSSAASRESGALTVVTLVALLGQPSRRGGQPHPAQATEAANDIATVPSELLASLIGSAESAELLARARADLEQHVGLLLDEELLRFGEIIDEAGPVDAVAAVRLYQAEYSLEAAR
jgi:hypothetical protein